MARDIGLFYKAKYYRQAKGKKSVNILVSIPLDFFKCICARVYFHKMSSHTVHMSLQSVFLMQRTLGATRLKSSLRSSTL